MTPTTTKKAAAKPHAKAAKATHPRVKTAVRAVSPKPRAKNTYVAAVGRRKTAVARVRLIPGSIEFTVNGKPLLQYFPQADLQELIMAPLKLVGKDADHGCSVKVSGGGYHGQAEAVRHGISRCLLLLDAGLRPTLKPHGYLTRDSRMKERKKPGLKRARRAPQWSKR
ncbi:MAG: small subunit ribosomal protein S9 [Parcubacteria group bacterium Gr01-1014_31]|nr:MAG: small subunit ribosomal protein S9 [Parcubacteria group bacterium Gr01-1014_31]